MKTTSDLIKEVETISVDANGVRFEVDTQGEGDRLVLCLHGFPEHSIAWRFQMPYLANLGYRVWAPNMRGYGNTDAPKGLKNYQLEVLMKDVEELIQASDASEVTLLSHDWGALIAWHLAMRKSAMCRIHFFFGEQSAEALNNLGDRGTSFSSNCLGCQN